MSAIVRLRTGVWYGDRQVEIEFPDNWQVDVIRPDFPPPLSQQEIESALDSPFGRPGIEALCRGKKRPLIVVDDLNRPTPAAAVVPAVMKRLSAAGIPPEDVTFLMATGTHGRPGPEALYKKVGAAAAGSRMLIHDCFNDAVRIGSTRAGTPIDLNRAIIESDVVIGIGGIYPNHTAGFGGGTKLILGVLGIRSIYALHFSNRSQGWGESAIDPGFRRELDEIAEKAGLDFVISLIIDGDRSPIQMYCGDPRRYFPDAVAYYRKVYDSPGISDADVVIANTYPLDLSLTFARMKGFSPFAGCGEGVTRIAIASCDEGVGMHNIWPFGPVSRLHRLRHIVRVLRVKPGWTSVRRMAAFLNKKLRPAKARQPEKIAGGAVRLFRTAGRAGDFHNSYPGLQLMESWPEVIRAAVLDHPEKRRLKAVVYPFSFLQLVGGAADEIPPPHPADDMPLT